MLLSLTILGTLAGALGSAAERALAGANRVRLRSMAADRGWRGKATLWLLDEPIRAWLAAQLLRLCGLALAASAGGALIALGVPDFGTSITGSASTPPPVGPLVSAVALWSAALATIGAWLPAALARRDETSALHRLSVPLYLAALLFGPVLTIAHGLERLVSGPFEVDRSWREEELRSLAHVDEDEGPIEEDAIGMIAGIFELGDTRVREVMVPRIDMVTVKLGAPVIEIVDTIMRCGHSRIPVIRDTVDDVVGVLYAKDLLKAYRDRDFSPDVASLLREARFVPESKPVIELLSELQTSRVHLVLVMDEFGGTAGLVTIEDLLEEIVGEIQDEYDTEESEVESLGESEGVFRAEIHIEDVNRMLGLHLPTERDETLAGLVFSHLGRLPQVGDNAMFDDASIEVLSIVGRRIKRVRVVRRGEWEDASG